MRLINDPVASILKISFVTVACLIKLLYRNICSLPIHNEKLIHTYIAYTTTNSSLYFNSAIDMIGSETLLNPNFRSFSNCFALRNTFSLYKCAGSTFPNVIISFAFSLLHAYVDDAHNSFTTLAL